MKALLVDNFDSFTYNIYQYMGEVFGEPPTVVKNDVEGVEFDDFEVIVISPGPGAPWVDKDFGICKSIIQTLEKPILGICLGHQGIVSCLGGQVGVADEPYHGRTSEIIHSAQGLFANLPNPLTAVRYHSLVAREPLPECLEVTARTKCGLIMAVEHKSRPLWGVQFHPESIYTEYGRQFFDNFKTMAKPWIKRRRGTVLKQSIKVKAGAETQPIGPAVLYQCHHRKLQSQLPVDQVYESLFADSLHSFWLDSSAAIKSESRFSFMGDAQGEQSFYYEYRIGLPLKVHYSSQKIESLNVDHAQFLRQKLNARVVGENRLPFSFCGGFVGYHGYETKSDTENLANHHASATPDAAGYFVDRFIAYDHDVQCYYLVGINRSDGDAVEILSWLAQIEEQILSICSQPDTQPGTPEERGNLSADVVFSLEDDRDSYMKKIERCKHYIRQGESYEICLTNRIRAQASFDPLSLYQKLRKINPAPRAAFLRAPGYSVLSCSPEKFISLARNKVVEAKPIKGTRRRGLDQSEDAVLLAELLNSPKDRAENLMITDLLRNDLNRVCEVGSVWTPKLMQVETFSSVHQLVSTIRGRLMDPLTAVDLLQATFPPGSMTGAPKRRTLEIIDELESSSRGIYSGAIGYLSLNGTADFNVVIRTLVVRDDQLEIGVGGAITMLSDAEEEFLEILVKGRALMRALALHLTGDEKKFSLNYGRRDSSIERLLHPPLASSPNEGSQKEVESRYLLEINS
jgi:para-aminobenzoate synthetase